MKVNCKCSHYKRLKGTAYIRLTQAIIDLAVLSINKICVLNYDLF